MEVVDPVLVLCIVCRRRFLDLDSRSIGLFRSNGSPRIAPIIFDVLLNPVRKGVISQLAHLCTLLHECVVVVSMILLHLGWTVTLGLVALDRHLLNII